MTLFKSTLTALALVTVPLAAQAAPKLSEIVAGLEQSGYLLRELEVKTDRIEVEATTAAGARVELDVDPATGAVRSERPDN